MLLGIGSFLVGAGLATLKGLHEYLIEYRKCGQDDFTLHLYCGDEEVHEVVIHKDAHQDPFDALEEFVHTLEHAEIS